MTWLSSDGPPAVVSLTSGLPTNAAPAATGWPSGPWMPRRKAILSFSGSSGVNGPTRPARWCGPGTPPPRKMLNARAGGAAGAAHTLRVRISSRNGSAMVTPPAPRKNVRRLRLRMYLMASPWLAGGCSFDRRVTKVGGGGDGRDQIGERAAGRCVHPRLDVGQHALIAVGHRPSPGELGDLGRHAGADARVLRQGVHVRDHVVVGHRRPHRQRDVSVLANGVAVNVFRLQRAHRIERLERVGQRIELAVARLARLGLQARL